MKIKNLKDECRAFINFGEGVRFVSAAFCSPAYKLEPEVLYIKDKVVCTQSLVELFQKNISPEISRQWLLQAKVKYRDDLFNVPVYPIGNTALGSLFDERFSTADGSTLIVFSRWKESGHLNIVDNYFTFLTLLSQDLYEVEKGDFLVIGKEYFLDDLSKKMKHKYRSFTAYLPQGSEAAEVFKFASFFDGNINYIWAKARKDGHPKPKWETCSRCALFPRCKPQRWRWLQVCSRYKPIDFYGKPTDGGKVHYLLKNEKR